MTGWLAAGCGDDTRAVGDGGVAFGDGAVDGGASGGGEPDMDDGLEDCRELAREPGAAFVVNDVDAFVVAGLEFSAGVQQQLDDGNLLFAWELVGLDDEADDDEVLAAFALVRDRDDDPDDNFTGKEDLCIDPDFVDGDEDAPVITMDGAVEEGMLTAGPTDIALPPLYIMGLPIPEIPLKDATLSAAVEAGAGGLSDASMEAKVLLTDLNELDVAGVNLLTAIACGVSGIIPPTPPNVDVDGDGVETIVCEDEQVVSCADGDGTLIEGSGCGAELQDAYAFVMEFSAVPFVVAGVWQP
ncbi:MAG: hypothetical protein AABZ30_14770 [Myxococcota bacterium]